MRLPIGGLAVSLLSLLLPSPTGAGVEALPREPVAKVRDAKAHAGGGYRPAVESLLSTTEIEPNDDPATAQPVALGEVVQAALTVEDRDFFALDATAGSHVSVSTAADAGSGTDTFLRVFNADGSTLLAFDDDAGEGLFSALPHVLVPADGRLLVAVTHFAPTGTGTYLLALESGTPPPPPPANDACAAAVTIPCNDVLSGTTLGAADDVGGDDACVSYAPNGADVFYRVQLPFSHQLTVQATPLTSYDLSLYLFEDCGDLVGTCLAGEDRGFVGEAEIVTYVNEVEGEPRWLTIGVDSWGPRSRGEFMLSVSCEFVVPNQTASWGTLKASFTP